MKKTILPILCCILFAVFILSGCDDQAKEAAIRAKVAQADQAMAEAVQLEVPTYAPELYRNAQNIYQIGIQQLKDKNYEEANLSLENLIAVLDQAKEQTALLKAQKERQAQDQDPNKSLEQAKLIAQQEKERADAALASAKALEKQKKQQDQLEQEQLAQQKLEEKRAFMEESKYEGTKYKTIVYTVKKHDYLWMIAKKPSVYGNPFKWYKIYNSNKELIKDPRKIYPGQKLYIRKVISK